MATRARSEIAKLAAEANAIRESYLAFWGAHSSSDINRVGVEPQYPKTPLLDDWYPRDGSKGKA